MTETSPSEIRDAKINASAKAEHSHEPGECKHVMTHEDDRMCDYCHGKAADDLIATLPPGK